MNRKNEETLPDTISDQALANCCQISLRIKSLPYVKDLCLLTDDNSDVVVSEINSCVHYMT